MNIGILDTKIKKRIPTEYYSSQQLGVARELVHYFDKVTVYYAIKKNVDISQVERFPSAGIEMVYIPCSSIGSSGLIPTNKLDINLDVLVYFSDIQLYVPRVYEWCNSNEVKFIPYIGAIASHSTSMFCRKVMDMLSWRNIQIYKKCLCLAKTLDIKEALYNKGVSKVKVAPVGLDLSTLNEKHMEANVISLKNKYGFKENDKVILFIGRFVDEKRPIDMVVAFNKIFSINKDYRLLLVGEGPLEGEVNGAINKMALNNYVKLIAKIPNTQIWELYRIADCFVNLNKQEIFGMAILEAMYYGCKVIAHKAPGPNMIVVNGETGWLFDDDEDIIKYVLDETDFAYEAHERILEKFTWEYTAKIIADLVKS